MTQLTITQIGRYKILGVIGEGGMGIVYRALDPNMAREVAIKMPHGDKELLEHFQREVRATASFQHKNIVTVHTVDEFEGFPYMVMEYLDGQSMAEAISSGRVLTLADKLSLVIQVCDGLQYAHELGVIHRDIKPANVYILKDRFKDRDLVAKILDFGIARTNVDSSITRTGQVRGSISYMSPEQISGKKLDFRTDIYSTGVLLFQFISGEVPYKSSDPNAAFLKILNDPVPSLTAYVKDCPAALEEIIRRAMAKDLEERYQTAEEFGYELSRLLETVKRGMTHEFLEQAKAAALRRDLDLARQHLLEILKLDRHHAQANELLQAVRQELQKQQKFLQVQQLRSQAQIAFSGLQYEEALECLDQACQIAPDDRDLFSFRESIKDAAKRAKSLEEALRRGQAALYVGDLQEAEAAVDEALKCEAGHTEARALKELIKKELDERSRRQQVKVFVEQARHEISKSQFIEALEALEKARVIDPADSNIRELLLWANRGHQQEQRRSELEAITKEVGRLLAVEDYKSASDTCETVLRKYPEEQSLVKLKQLADRQSESARKKRFVEEQCEGARLLSDAGSYTEAIEVLQKALRLHPDEESLTALLAMTRNETEFRKKEKIAAERFDVQLDHNKLPSSQPAHGLDEIHRLDEGIRKATSSSDVAAFVERSGFLARRHAADSSIQAVYQRTLIFATKFREEMDAALAEISRLDETTRSCRDVSQLLEIHQKIKAIQVRWPHEKQFSNVVDRASERLYAATEAKNAIQLELAHLEQSVIAAHSVAQISLYIQQSKILSVEWANDRDITEKLTLLEKHARTITDRVESACTQIKLLTSKLLNAPTLKESETAYQSATALAFGLENFEEVQDLLEKSGRRITERKNDYRRIELGLQSLINSSASVRGTVELELILARSRDLLSKYPGDQHFNLLVADLEVSLGNKRAELAERAALEEAAEIEGSSSLVDTSEIAILISAGTDPAMSKSHLAAVRLGVEPPARNPKPLIFGAVGLVVCLLLAAGAALSFYPREIEVLATPIEAAIRIDGSPCAQPCMTHLKPGKHDVTAALEGHEEFDQAFTVSVLSNPPWKIDLKPAPTEVKPAPPILTPIVPDSRNTASILVQIAPVVSGATVFLDDSAVALTDSAGKAVIKTVPGPHSIRVGKSAYQEVLARNVNLSQNNPAHLKFQLEKSTTLSATLPPPPIQPASPVLPSPAPQVSASLAPPDTFIVLQAPTGAEIHIDQQLAGHSTGSPIKTKVQPGQQHTIEVFLSGFQTWSRTVAVTAGKEEDLTASLTPIPALNVPSNPTPARAAPGISDDDRKQIQQLLDRYAEGYGQKNIKQIQALWPSIPGDTVKTIKEFFKNSKSVSMKIQLTDATPAGKRVTIECTQTLGYDLDGKQSVHTVFKTLYVVKSSTGWLIDFIPDS